VCRSGRVARGVITRPGCHPGPSRTGEPCSRRPADRRDVASSRSYPGHLHIVPARFGPPRDLGGDRASPGVRGRWAGRIAGGTRVTVEV
jgi:hypothetical protein